MYCVVISHYANASERQRAMIGKNTSLPDMHLKRFFQCCVAIPKRAKASERQRAASLASGRPSKALRAL